MSQKIVRSSRAVRPLAARALQDLSISPGIGAFAVPLLHSRSLRPVAPGLTAGTPQITFPFPATASKPRLFSTTRPSFNSTATATQVKQDEAPQWTPPSEEALNSRPVLIIGTGNLGRRIATVWASNRRDVTLFDVSDEALKSATWYITDALGAYCTRRDTFPGRVRSTRDPRVAAGLAPNKHDGPGSPLAPPWMAIDCLPEDLPLKARVLSDFARRLPSDCLLASNSSSFRAAELASAAQTLPSDRLLNTHYYVPPRNRMVELMSSGDTHAEVFPFLAAQMRRIGLRPMVVPAGVQSQGFIFNRIWAAMKRETLAVLAQGVGKPEEIDALFKDFFHAEKGPCERMDEIGLDTAARVEKHYLEQRPELAIGALKNQKPLEWLKEMYLDKGNLGKKTGDGLFTNAERAELKRIRKNLKQKDVEEVTDA